MQLLPLILQEKLGWWGQVDMFSLKTVTCIVHWKQANIAFSKRKCRFQQREAIFMFQSQT